METIRVRLLTHASGPAFSLSPGHVADLDREQAEAMIAGGYAERVEPAPGGPVPSGQVYLVGGEAGPEVVVSPVETATSGPQRSPAADDQLAAERAGRAAAEAGEARRVPNGIDGRSATGRAWLRGYDLYHRPEKE